MSKNDIGQVEEGANVIARNLRTLKVNYVLAAAIWIAAAQSAAAQSAACVNTGAGTATTWSPWECVLEVADSGTNLTGRKGYLNRLKVEYSTTGVAKRVGYAAWDGQLANGKHRFVIRHLFEMVSETASTTWTWKTLCETSSSCGAGTTSPSLITSGQVVVSPYTGTNTLQKKGLLSFTGATWQTDAGTHRKWGYLNHFAGGGKFTWVADSAWAAPMKASDADWATYLNNRSSRVSVIQIGPAPPWAGNADQGGRVPFIKISGCTTAETAAPTPCEIPNPEFWRAFEGKIKAANQRGLYIFLAGLMEPRDRYPTATEAVNFAHWLAARLGHCFVVFSPSFDSPKVSRNGQNLPAVVGKELKRVNPLHLVTNHWATIELGDIYSLHDEGWLDFEMFQSGHNQGAPNQATQLALVTQRPREMAGKIAGSIPEPAYPSFATNIKPTINGEGIYDQGGEPNALYSDYRTRQAGYLSWLSGADGYSFGVGGIWDWGLCGTVATDPTNPCDYQIAFGWRNFLAGMGQDSAKSMQYLKQLMTSYGNNPFLDTYEQIRILNQELTDQSKKMVVGRTGYYSMLAYLPDNKEIKLKYTTGSVYTTANPCTAMFYNPKTGLSSAVCAAPAACNATTRNCSNSNILCSSPADHCTWKNFEHVAGSPATNDRVLQLGPIPARMWEGEAKRALQVFDGKLTESSPWGINGWLLDSRHTPIGVPFPIFSMAGLEGRSPAVAHDGKGDFLVVWQVLEVESTDIGAGIFGQRVKASGALEGAPFRISPWDTRELTSPAVALDEAGDAVVVWRSIDPVTGNGEIWARSLSRVNGLGEPSAVAAGAQIDCSQPKAVMSRNGSLSVAWVERDLQLEQESVRLRHFGEAKLAASPSTEQVSSVEAPGFWLINLHLDDAGKLEVEYEARFGAQGGGTYLQTFSADGSKLGVETQLASPLATLEEVQ